MIVPALLPPPAPFKIFVLLAGVAAVPVWQFVTAVAVARFVRYFGEGLLAVFYGEAAIRFVTSTPRRSDSGCPAWRWRGGWPGLCGRGESVYNQTFTPR